MNLFFDQSLSVGHVRSFLDHWTV